MSRDGATRVFCLLHILFMAHKTVSIRYWDTWEKQKKEKEKNIIFKMSQKSFKVHISWRTILLCT